MALQRGPQAMGGLQGTIAALQSATRYNEMMQRAKMQREASRAQMLNTILQGGIRYGLQAQELKARASLASDAWDQKDELMRSEYGLRLDELAVKQGYPNFEAYRDPTPEQRKAAKAIAMRPAELKAEELKLLSGAEFEVYQREAGPRAKIGAKAERKRREILGPLDLKQYKKKLDAQGEAQAKAQAQAAQRQQVQQFDQQFMQSGPQQYPKPWQPMVRQLQQEYVGMTSPEAGIYNGTDGRPAEKGLVRRMSNWRGQVRRLRQISGGPKQPTPAQQFGQATVTGQQLAQANPAFQPILKSDPNMANALFGFDGKKWYEVYSPVEAQLKQTQAAKTRQDAQPEPEDKPAIPLHSTLTPDVKKELYTQYLAWDKLQYDKEGARVGEPRMRFDEWCYRDRRTLPPINEELISKGLVMGSNPEEVARSLVRNGYDLKYVMDTVGRLNKQTQQQRAAIQEQQRGEKIRIEMQRQETVQQMGKYKEKYPDLSKAPPEVQEWVRRVMGR